MRYLLKDLGELFEKRLFADARLICYEPIGGNGMGNGPKGDGGKRRVEIPVHKAILMTRSKFFSEHFADGKEELEVPNFPVNVVKIGIAYLYTDQIPLDMKEEELISLYHASELYDLGIFETENIQLELVIAPLPTAGEFPKQMDVIDEKTGKRKRTELEYASTFSSTYMDYACSKDWGGKMRVGLRGPPPAENQQPPGKQSKLARGKQQAKSTSTDQGTDAKKMHMDFVLETEGYDQKQKVLVADLSLSVLNFAKEKVKTVKREGVSSVKAEKIEKDRRTAIFYAKSWEDCFDYDQIVNNKDLLLQHIEGQQSLPRLVVHCEASVIVSKKFKRYAEGNDEYEEKVGCQKALAELLEKGRFSDARIVCYEQAPKGKKGGKNKGKKVVIPVHKFILASRSKFFAAAFSTAKKEKKSGEIEIPPEMGLSSEGVRIVLSFIYTAIVPWDEELDQPTLTSILKAALIYELHGLSKYCEGKVKPVVENCAELLSLAHTYNNEAMMKKALNFLRKNKKAVKESSGWRHLMDEKSADGKQHSKHAALKTLCGHWLLEIPLSLENCCEVLQLAHRYGNGELESVALTFLLYDEEAVAETDGWRRLMGGEAGEEGQGKWLKALIKKEKRTQGKFHKFLQNEKNKKFRRCEEDSDSSDDGSSEDEEERHFNYF